MLFWLITEKLLLIFISSINSYSWFSPSICIKVKYNSTLRKCQLKKVLSFVKFLLKFFAYLYCIIYLFIIELQSCRNFCFIQLFNFTAFKRYVHVPYLSYLSFTETPWIFMFTFNKLRIFQPLFSQSFLLH